MTTEQKHLLIGVGIGIAVAYLWVNKRKKIAAAIPDIAPTGHAVLTTSDYGNPVIVANNGRLNTVIGMRSPIETTYHDFNQLIANPNNVLNGYSSADVQMETQRAMQFLNEIGWLTLFENYESELPTPKQEDPIIFALNLGAGFRLLPPAVIVAAPVMSTPMPPATSSFTGQYY